MRCSYDKKELRQSAAQVNIRTSALRRPQAAAGQKGKAEVCPTISSERPSQVGGGPCRNKSACSAAVGPSSQVLTRSGATLSGPPSRDRAPRAPAQWLARQGLAVMPGGRWKRLPPQLLTHLQVSRVAGAKPGVGARDPVELPQCWRRITPWGCLGLGSSDSKSCREGGNQVFSPRTVEEPCQAAGRPHEYRGGSSRPHWRHTREVEARPRARKRRGHVPPLDLARHT